MKLWGGSRDWCRTDHPLALMGSVWTGCMTMTTHAVLAPLLLLIIDVYDFFPCPGHLPVHPSSTDPICLLWNFDEVLALIRSHSSVVCFMAGHDHDGGYHLDQDTGVHHVTVEGVIETPPDSDAFGLVCVYEDRMELKGSGRVEDRVLFFQQRCTRGQL